MRIALREGRSIRTSKLATELECEGWVVLPKKQENLNVKVGSHGHPVPSPQRCVRACVPSRKTGVRCCANEVINEVRVVRTESQARGPFCFFLVLRARPPYL
jgi:hypothetical protein